VKPLLPDHGVPFQLVHHDDVAAASVAGVLGGGSAGVYNFAGAGLVRWSDVANELDWYTVLTPGARSTSPRTSSGGFRRSPSKAGWLEALRVPMLMDCTGARQRLGWRTAYDGRQTLHELVARHR
jgi:UDP-glucose 4-epimerase